MTIILAAALAATGLCAVLAVALARAAGLADRDTEQLLAAHRHAGRDRGAAAELCGVGASPLDDRVGVVDHRAVVQHERRHPAVARQLLNLAPAARAVAAPRAAARSRRT